MSKLRVNCFSLSLDGFGAGPDQDLENPLGRGGMAVHDWFRKTRSFQQMIGNSGGDTGLDDDFAAVATENVGASILGRNMFGPVRGPWPDESWKGWWGEEPPYHTDVFVLTHHARDPIPMAGGTTFYFVTEGIEAALERARAAAKGRDVRLGGGVSTVRQYMQAGLLDEGHFTISPLLLGRGEALFAGLDLPALGYRVRKQVPSAEVTHVIIERT